MSIISRIAPRRPVQRIIVPVRPPATLEDDWVLRADGSDRTHRRIATESMSDAARLRAWAVGHPLVFGIFREIIRAVLSTEWTVRPRDPQEPFDQRLIDECQALLESPNRHGLNQSFRTFFEAVLFDMEGLNLGAWLPQRNGYGWITSMHAQDGAQVEYVAGWECNEDGPRYKMRNGKNVMWLWNDELTTMSSNPTTWDQRGVPVLRVIHDTLLAQVEAFEAQRKSQKRKQAPGVLNIPRAASRIVEAVKDYYKSDIEGQATIGVSNLPENTRFINFGLVGNASDWVQFTDACIRIITFPLGMMPSDIGWSVGTHRATAEFETEKSGERSLAPRRNLLEETLNREVVPSFGEPNAEFAWLGIGGKDEMRLAQICSTLAATKAFSIADLRRIAGENPLEYDDPVAQCLVDDPIIDLKSGDSLPLRLYAVTLRHNFPDAAGRLDAEAQQDSLSLSASPAPGGVTVLPHQANPSRLLTAQRSRTPDPEDEIQRAQEQYADLLDTVIQLPDQEDADDGHTDDRET